VLKRAADSPELSPQDFYIFGQLKKVPMFMLDSDMQGTVVQYLRQQMNFVQMGVTSSTSVVLCLNAGVIFTDLNV
jgi:hypothetical protein